jgi:hypothetical protein
MKTKLATIAAAAAISLGAAFAATAASAAPATALGATALGTASAAPATASVQKVGYYFRRRCFPTYSYGYRWVHGYYGWHKQFYRVFTGYRCRIFRYYY